jgi:hypothetical protein
VQKLSSVVAVVLSLVALALVALDEPSAVQGPIEPSGGASAAPTDRLAELEREVGRLRAELALRPVPSGTSGEDSRRVVEAAVRLDELEEASRRVAELETRLASVEGDVIGLREQAPVTMTFSTSRPQPEGDVVDWQLRAMDAGATAEERLAALRALRFAEWEGGDARTGEVVAAMVDLARTADDAGVRADVWRQLDEVADPAMLDPLLAALANDPDSEVREEAAETLAPFLPNPIVEAALRAAFENDASRDVREQAGESLAR